MYPEEIWESIQRHPSGKAESEDPRCIVEILSDMDLDAEWGDWLEEVFDPDAPVPYLPTDRIEDLEI